MSTNTILRIYLIRQIKKLSFCKPQSTKMTCPRIVIFTKISHLLDDTMKPVRVSRRLIVVLLKGIPHAPPLPLSRRHHLICECYLTQKGGFSASSFGTIWLWTLNQAWPRGGRSIRGSTSDRGNLRRHCRHKWSRVAISRGQNDLFDKCGATFSYVHYGLPLWASKKRPTRLILPHW